VGVNSTPTYYTTLPDWQSFTGADNLSFFTQPFFVSSTNLHLQSVTNNVPFNGKAVPITGVTTDIDGETREASTPDVGADEFTPPLSIDMGVVSFNRPTNISCHSAAEPVMVTIVNNSGANHNFSTNPTTITINITGAATRTNTVVINSGTLNSGTTMQVQVGTINTLTNGVYNFNVSISVAGDVNSANNTTSSSATIMYTPLTVSPSTPKLAVCHNETAAIASNASNGTPPYTYLWSTGQTTANITTPALTANTSYNVRVTDACGVQVTRFVDFVVNNPLLNSTTPATRCGAGTVTLGATASAGSTIAWFETASGGTPLATGNMFTTPILNTTKSYFAAAASVPVTYSAGMTSPISQSTGAGQTTYGLVFTALTDFELKSLVIYPTSNTAPSSGLPGTIDINIYNNSNVLVHTKTVNVTAYPAGFYTAQRVTLDFDIAPGTYRISPSERSSDVSGLVFTSYTAATNPFPLAIPGVLNITHSTINANNAIWENTYYYFYDWEVVASCYSGRTAIQATITTTPSITASATMPVVCQGGSSTLSVSSTNSNYTYTWTPGNVTGNTRNVTPSGTTKYYVNAVDGSCTAIDSVTVFVQQPISALSQNLPNVCSGNTVTLSASPATGYAANSLQWQSSADGINFTDIPSATGVTYTTSALHLPLISDYKQKIVQELPVLRSLEQLQLIIRNCHLAPEPRDVVRVPLL
jgi:hypothetical protein